MPQRDTQVRSAVRTGAGRSGERVGERTGERVGGRTGIRLGCAVAAALALGGCDPRPTLKLHLFDIPAGTDSLQTSVWLRSPSPGSSNGFQVQEYGGPGYRDQIITPRTPLTDRATVGLDLEEEGERQRASVGGEDSSVVVVVLARAGTQLVGRGIGQSLFSAAEPLFPDILDIRLSDPLPGYKADDAARAAARGYSDIRSTCSLTNEETLPELSVEGWGFPTTMIARFEEGAISGTDMGTGTGTDMDMGTEPQAADVFEQPYLADSSAQIRIKFDERVKAFSPPLLKLTLSFRNSDGTSTEFYSLPQVQATCPKGLPPMIMNGGGR